jgi:redox-sensitive bicupin YhaK (pirin superfamily)
VTSPVRLFASTLYAEAHLEPGQAITLPEADERAVYAAEGELRAREDVIPEHAMAVFGPERGVVLTATTRSRIAIIGGENIGHRHIEWNFVSSRKERIEQAKRDWKEGRFPKVPGDELEFIPLPE